MNLENLVNLLNDNEKNNEANEIIKIVNLLEKQLKNILDTCSSDAAKAGENFDFEKIKKIKTIKDEIDKILKEIALPEKMSKLSEFLPLEDSLDGPFFDFIVNENDSADDSAGSILEENKEDIKEEDKKDNDKDFEEFLPEISDDYIVLSLEKDLAFTSPKLAIVNGETLKNDAGTWSNMLNVFANFFAKQNPTKFLEYTKMVNRKNVDGYRYSKSKSEKSYFYIYKVDRYLIYHGSSTFIGKCILEMIKYFEYEDKYIIYGIRKSSDKPTAVIKKPFITELKIEEIPDIKLGEYEVGGFVNHKRYGVGRIKEINKILNQITISFSGEFGTKTFSTISREMESLTPLNFMHFNK